MTSHLRLGSPVSAYAAILSLPYTIPCTIPIRLTRTTGKHHGCSHGTRGDRHQILRRLRSGGGTIIGLAKKLLPIAEFGEIVKLAETRDLGTVDLLLEDIIDKDMGFLNRKTTASNFGKMADGACSGDIALAIINMVYQVIGMLSVFAARSKGID